jgi:hypothetical protein
LPEETSVVLLHALNPYGFAWRRRVNENNVDLNRNFLLPGDPYAGAPAELRELNGIINPGTPPPRVSLFLLQIFYAMLRYGRRRLLGALSQRQFEFPEGLFYGGSKPEEATTLVQDHFADWVGQAPRVLHLDFHSGLGRFAQCQLFSIEPVDSPRGKWLVARFGTRVVDIDAPTRVRRGTICSWLNATQNQSGRCYAFLAPEFGTFGPLRVFKSLREENRVHRFPAHRAYERLHQDLVEVFCPASVCWREAVVEEGLALIARALQVYQDETWEIMPVSRQEQVVGANS